MVLRLHGGEPVPADCVVLRSSHPDGVSCHVETSNIDGETNLKTRRAIVGLPAPPPRALHVVAEPPNGNVHQFRGYATPDPQQAVVLAADESSLLLRGSTVQNVSHVDALVVYTGRDSKLARNASPPRLKLSMVEKTMNRLIRMVFAWLFAMVTLATLCMVVYRRRHQAQMQTYLQGSGDAFFFPIPVAYWLTFLILFSNALPMSLYVTVEMVNFGQAYFVSCDADMYDAASDTPARAVTSNLNSDLGQVEYLFSDKTGTLTKNVMTFKRCAVAGKLFGAPLAAEAQGRHAFEPLDALASFPAPARDFLVCLAVAHTVVVENGEWRAESPDELALCQGAKQLGFAFRARTSDAVVVGLPEGKTETCVLVAGGLAGRRAGGLTACCACRGAAGIRSWQ
jgi:phospholipid-transporting ATPase